MKFAVKPSVGLNGLILAGLLATLGSAAMAQGAGAPANAAPAAGTHAVHDGWGRHDPAKMQALIARHQGDLKAKLKITPAQEGAWTAYAASMQPPAHGARPTPEQRAEFDKLTTPERIDKMRALRTQHMQEMSVAMDKRADSTKALYAALSPEQKKTFDAEHQRGRHGEHGGHFGPGPNKG